MLEMSTKLTKSKRRLIKRIKDNRFPNAKSLAFDGVDDYVEVPDDASLRFDTGDFTISAWVKRGEDDAAHYLVSKYQSFLNGWALIISGNNLVQLMLRGSWFSYAAVTSSSEITGNSWHHIVATADRDGNGQIYIDGSADGSAVDISGITMDTTSVVRFGTEYIGFTFFNGNMDEVAIWDVALDSDAVSAIYNSGTPIALDSDSGDYDNSGDLQGWWRMGEGDTYPTITDNSTNSNDGTMTNMASDDIVGDTP